MGGERDLRTASEGCLQCAVWPGATLPQAWTREELRVWPGGCFLIGMADGGMVCCPTPKQMKGREVLPRLHPPVWASGTVQLFRVRSTRQSQWGMWGFRQEKGFGVGMKLWHVKR